MDTAEGDDEGADEGGKHDQKVDKDEPPHGDAARAPAYTANRQACQPQQEAEASADKVETEQGHKSALSARARCLAWQGLVNSRRCRPVVGGDRVLAVLDFSSYFIAVIPAV